ncbi:calcium-binding protein [Methylovulum miyakonense]|uniref:calcium-binding protein n=1 Tax=Methylovulum miyakonense TaxID=645578 RepID=UPI003BB53DA1
MNFHPTTNSYKDDRYPFILLVEETGNAHLTPYNDGKNNVTIGVGFNLADDTVRNLVFAKLGITNLGLIHDLAEYLGQKQEKSDATIQNDLNKIMDEFSPGANFKFINEDQIKELFNGVDGNNGLVQTYENRVNTWAQNNGLAPIPESKERLVLLSLSYNGVLNSSVSLAAAIRNDNRAEAWFEIRYNSNGDDSPGLAKRHYYEAKVFSLYNDETNITADEAKQIYRMLELHRDKILNYENDYGNMIDNANSDFHLSGNATVESLSDTLTEARDALFADLQANYPTGMAGLDASNFDPTHIYLDPGRNTAQQAYNPDHGATLTGSDGKDILIGENGNDTLIGGEGDDVLIGGNGLDIYVWNTGDGSDIIIDEDMKGIIKINGGSGQDLLVAGGFQETSPGSNEWAKTLPDGSVLKLTHHSPWRLVLADGSVLEFADDLKNGDFGIFREDAKETTPTHVYIGDQHAPLNDSNSHYDWGQTHWSEDGTLVGGIAEADFNDVITVTDYAGDISDDLKGLGGNDALDGGAGDDKIYGGEGDDLLGGGKGSDLIYGGAGNDYIVSAHGLVVPQRTSPNEEWNPPEEDQTVWIKASNWGVAENNDEDKTHTVYGGGLTVADDKPDTVWAEAGDDRVVGGKGDDHLDGGEGDDKLWGQAGKDTLIGGQGKDFLDGDGVVKTGFFQTVAANEQGADYLDGGLGDDILKGGGNNDIIIGGDGADALYGDDTRFEGDEKMNLSGEFHGDDYLDGGKGNDTLLGSGGDDILLGGDGDDQLNGDDALGTLDIGYHGHDFLDGGEGNDGLLGGGGDDSLFGGAGLDRIYGQAGDDNMDGGLDDDELSGDDGDDSLQGGDGIDLLLGGDGNDFLDGGSGDELSSGNGNTAGEGGLDGGAGDDVIYGRSGMDELVGAEGDDFLDGGDDEDLLFGGAGNDILLGGNGKDQLQGGDDDDMLEGGEGNDIVFAESGDDTVEGGGGNDRLDGGDGDDSLDGGNGNDLLIDGLGDNVFFGGTGNDQLLGRVDIYYLSQMRAETKCKKPMKFMAFLSKREKTLR